MQYTLAQVKAGVIKSLESRSPIEQLTCGVMYNGKFFTILEILKAIEKDSEIGKIHIIKALRFINKETKDE